MEFVHELERLVRKRVLKRFEDQSVRWTEDELQASIDLMLRGMAQVFAMKLFGESIFD